MSTTGTLIDTHTGKRTSLSVPGCPRLGSGMFGGPWLLIECELNPGPRTLLYKLPTRRSLSVTFDHAVGPPGGVCGPDGNCSVVGVGRYRVEIESSAYHQANSYFLQPIPTGSFSGFNVFQGGHTAFDLNSLSGLQMLCSPLRYPRAPWMMADGTRSYEPGWMKMLGQFALAADNYPAPSAYSYARLERCGSPLRIRLPPTAGIAATKRGLAWWTPGHIAGIRLPSLRRFSIATPAAVTGRNQSPMVALSASKVYLAYGGGLWAAPFP